MNSRQAELWKKIEAFAIDDQTGDAGLSFESRLARENAWSRETARRVIEEYKKFVFLAMCAGHPVTPSDQVDQAWHLHLTYTRSYWERLCGGVLPKRLHHDPTRGGELEDHKFNDWYARTKQSYQRLFGVEAPAEIWPDASVRFGDDLHFQRINTRHHWVVSKQRVKRSARIAAVVGVPGAMLVGCTPLLLAASGSDDENLAVGLFIFVGVMFLLFGIAGIRRSNGGGSRGSGGSGGCGGCGTSGCGGGGCGGGGCGGGD
jgi:hypothetical protein